MRSLLFLLLFPNLVIASDWPFPQDTPVSTNTDITLAGEYPIDISRFLAVRGASRVSINSVGTHIAFVSSVTGTPQLWVQQVNGNQARQLTFGPGISFYRWHPSGQALVYGADNDGNEKEAFYLINRNGLSEQVLLPASDAFRSFGSFATDGKSFTFASTQRNGRDFDIYQFDMENKVTSLLLQAEYGFYPRPWQPGSNNLLVAETRGEDAEDVYLLNSKTKRLTPLFKPDVASAFNSFNWDGTGQRLFFVSNLDREMNAIYRYSTQTQQAEVFESSRYDLNNARLCYNDAILIWTENKDGFDTLWVKQLSENMVKPIALPKGVYQVSCADKSTAISVRINGPTTPGHIYVVDAQSGYSEVVYRPTMAGISPNKLVTPLPISFPSQDGITLYGLLYLPETGKDTQNQSFPIVIDVHGGPTAQARPSWSPLTQYLVGKGIAVLDINVRGSTGFGKTYMRKDNQEKRLDSVRDLVDAINYLKADPRIDTDRAAVMGGSYGGYMVNAVMGLYPDVFKAGASFVGVSNWVRALQTASPALKASDRIEYGDISDPKWQAFYEQNSPINTVDKITAPMFFEHGVNDPRDPVTESDEMVKVLREKNIPVTYLRFPDEGHSVSKMKNRIIFYRELARFLEQHLVTQQ